MGKNYTNINFSSSHLQQSFFLTKIVLKTFQKDRAIYTAKFITAKLIAL